MKNKSKSSVFEDFKIIYLKIEIVCKKLVALLAITVLEDPGLAVADGVLGTGLNDGLQHRVVDRQGDVCGTAQVLQLLLFSFQYCILNNTSKLSFTMKIEGANKNNLEED